MKHSIHGSAIVHIVPCGVHPLHFVKARASGARSGCPMCEAAIEGLCRSLKPRESSPRETVNGKVDP